MAGTSNTTTDHGEIRKWVEARQGKPATAKRTESGDEPGVLSIDFPGYSGAGSLEEISWEDFFQKFDEKKLAFLYQDTISSGEQSRFFKFVSHDTAEHKTADHATHKSAADTGHKKETSHASHSSTKTESKAHKDDEKSHASEHKTDSKNSKDSKDSKGSKSEHKTENKAASKSHKS
ncbi:MAG: hypothetical protein ABI406_09005 [Ktedonobacteraceae bacterium]